MLEFDDLVIVMSDFNDVSFGQDGIFIRSQLGEETAPSSIETIMMLHQL